MAFSASEGILKSERQLFLKLCVPNSGVLSKNETEQIQALEVNNVTYLKLLSEIEEKEKNLKTRLNILKTEKNQIEQKIQNLKETDTKDKKEELKLV